MSDSKDTDTLIDASSATEKVPTSHRREWHFPEIRTDDSLLGCLEIVAQIHGSTTSGAALVAGLPTDQGRLTPALFVRAADRAGLTANSIRKKIKSISTFTLPCVLILTGRKACLLVEADHEADSYKVIFPETGTGAVELVREDLEKIYTGVAIFVKKQYRYDQRSADIAVSKPRAWFWGTLKKSAPLYYQVLIAAIFINLFAIASPLFTMNVYDRVVPNNAYETLWVLAIGVLIIFVFDFILKMLRVYFVDTAGKKADVLLGARLFETIMTMKLQARPQSAGGFANEVREFETLREFFSSATLIALVDLPFVFVFLFIVYLIGGPIAYVPLAAVPIILICAFLLQAPVTEWVQQTFREAAQKHAILVEAITGLETIKSFGAEGRMQRNWERFIAQASNSSKALKFLAALTNNFSAFIQQNCYVFVVVVGVYLIIDGQLTMGALIASSILSARALAPLAQMVSLLTRLNQSMTALQVLDDLMHMPSERPKGKNFLHRPSLSGAVEFKDVTFRYSPFAEPALRDLNLKIQAGEKVGLIGRIGSGKSTIERLMLGLYHPTSGSLLFDETDIRQIDPADLRNNIGYVPQDIYLFFGTLRENMTFGSQQVDEQRFKLAAEISGVQEFANRNPAGFDMFIAEGGANLSGGQRQSIALARALVRQASIFVMDEPTAMMDHASEARITTRLEEYIADSTFVLVTHKVPLLRLVDRLVVIEDGRVVADGPKKKILSMLANSKIRSNPGDGS